MALDGAVAEPDQVADLDEPVARLARHSAEADDRDLDLLIGDPLAKAGPTGRRTDDVAFLALRRDPADDGP
ncbi:hypothetical protein [Streptomyces sp. JW3]|uniref:hypothetical protein n=1 Tax=Streptomyces sp. JW3 TaxID=3456955 RepID=UPI003FA4C814